MTIQARLWGRSHLAGVVILTMLAAVLVRSAPHLGCRRALLHRLIPLSLCPRILPILCRRSLPCRALVFPVAPISRPRKGPRAVPDWITRSIAALLGSLAGVEILLGQRPGDHGAL